jgi:hypothetical protein
LLFEAKMPRRLARHIDDPVLGERPAIIKPHNDRAAIFEVGNLHHGGQRQRRMGR